jgi:hypothetical protein
MLPPPPRGPTCVPGVAPVHCNSVMVLPSPPCSWIEPLQQVQQTHHKQKPHFSNRLIIKLVNYLDCARSLASCLLQPSITNIMPTTCHPLRSTDSCSSLMSPQNLTPSCHSLMSLPHVTASCHCLMSLPHVTHVTRVTHSWLKEKENPQLLVLL